jgi:hypothetical protein
MTSHIAPRRAPAHDPDLIHQSTRTSIATNADPSGLTPARITLRTSKLEIRWLDGDVALRFSSTVVDVTPSSNSRPARRPW